MALDAVLLARLQFARAVRLYRNARCAVPRQGEARRELSPL